MTARELILYACPTGPLAGDLETYFAEVSERFGATAAQTYPVHCSLTGFFRREGSRADEVVADLNAVLGDFGPPPPGSVTVDRLGVHEHWVGLELSSPWLLDLIATVVAADVPRGDEDALRPKDWLHVSLAYGVDDLSNHAAFARETVDVARPAAWTVGFWERNVNGVWTAH